MTGNINEGYSLYANNASAGAGAHRLTVRLHGAGPVARDAVGARVTVRTVDGVAQAQEVAAGSSLGAGHDLALHFGLGQAPIRSVEVRWRNGRTDVSDNGRLTLSSS